MTRIGSYRELRVYRQAFHWAMKLKGVVETHLEFAEACEYMEPAAVAEFEAAYDAILAQLATMRSHPEKWRPLPEATSARGGMGPRRIREAAGRYLDSGVTPSPPYGPIGVPEGRDEPDGGDPPHSRRRGVVRGQAAMPDAANEPHSPPGGPVFPVRRIPGEPRIAPKIVP